MQATAPVLVGARTSAAASESSQPGALTADELTDGQATLAIRASKTASREDAVLAGAMRKGRPLGVLGATRAASGQATAVNALRAQLPV